MDAYNDNMSFEELQEMVSICLDNIIEIKSENEMLKKKNGELEEKINALINANGQMVRNLEKVVNNTTIQVALLENGIDNVKYEITDPRCKKEEMLFPQICSIDTTIDLIINKGCSMARFGDGEFAIMDNKKRQKFQHLDEKLAKRLAEVIRSQEEGLLIGIADNYGCLDAYNHDGKQGIRYYMTEEVRKDHSKYLSAERVYHNAYISRPYALFADNMTDAPKKRFDALRKIWEDRKIIFVEGLWTRLGVGNNLFDNAKQIARIEAPPVHSFDKYDEILEAALKWADKDILFLIAMGPSAGVLAYDLYKAGYQAIDIGHVDLEYEWFLNGAGKRSAVKHKYNNEFSGGDNVEDIYDEEYLREILCIIE